MCIRDRLCRVGIDVDGTSEGSVVLECRDRVLGQRVDRVVADEVVDVERVGIRGILGGGRCPQRSLGARTSCRQSLPAIACEPIPKEPVGDLRLGHRRPATQRQRLSLIHI